MFEPQTHATISASSQASKDKIVFLFAPMPKYLTMHATCNAMVWLEKNLVETKIAVFCYSQLIMLCYV